MKVGFLFAMFVLLISFGCVSQQDDLDERGHYVKVAPNQSDFGDCQKPCHIDLGNYEGERPYYEDAPFCRRYPYDKPRICTLDYKLGDACLMYLDYEEVNGECRTLIDPRFNDCISCFKKCVDETEDKDQFQRCENLCKFGTMGMFICF